MMGLKLIHVNKEAPAIELKVWVLWKGGIILDPRPLFIEIYGVLLKDSTFSNVWNMLDFDSQLAEIFAQWSK